MKIRKIQGTPRIRSRSKYEPIYQKLEHDCDQGDWLRVEFDSPEASARARSSLTTGNVEGRLGFRIKTIIDHNVVYVMRGESVSP